MKIPGQVAVLAGLTFCSTSLAAPVTLKDPCVLVSRAEAEAVLGPLAGDPYRSRDDGTADPGGSSCFYRGASGHSFTVHPEYTGGKQMMKGMSIAGGLANQAMRDRSHEADLVEGDWDDQRWSPPGKLSALKGDVLVEVDVAGVAAGDANTAGKLANVALKRLGKPLTYDGAAAAKRAPGPIVPPRDPCSLVPAAEAKTILPNLAGPPRSTKSGCLYPLTKKGPLDPGDLSLTVDWSGGFVQMAGALTTFHEVVAQQTPTEYAHGTAKVSPTGGEVTVEKKTITPSKMQEDLKAVKEDPGYQSMLKGMEGVLGGGLSTSLRDPGATMRADKIDGPWERGYIMGGTGVMAVKKDVLIGVDGRGLDIDQARAMVTRAMSKL
ncbi:MAG TPA: hypothetical protein VMT11_11475 [Myxococcaceae bacterium]|nr:hypothetical protein [Myxococcaceae bacterium]